MFVNDKMETASTEVTSIRRQNDIEKSTWRSHRYFDYFQSRIHVEISRSNRWRIDEDVSIGQRFNGYIYLCRFGGKKHKIKK